MKKRILRFLNRFIDCIQDYLDHGESMLECRRVLCNLLVDSKASSLRRTCYRVNFVNYARFKENVSKYLIRIDPAVL